MAVLYIFEIYGGKTKNPQKSLSSRGVMKRAVKWTLTDVNTSTVDRLEKSSLVVINVDGRR